MTRGLAPVGKINFFIVFWDYTCLAILLISRSPRKLGWHSAEIILMLQLNQDSIGIWIWFSNTIPLLLYLRLQILVSISTFKDRCWLVTYHERTLLSSWLKYQAEKFLFIFLTWQQQKKEELFYLYSVKHSAHWKLTQYSFKAPKKEWQSVLFCSDTGVSKWSDFRLRDLFFSYLPVLWNTAQMQ